MEQYTVTGMSCAACSARVEKAVSAVPGVTACAVNLLTNSMGVEGTASEADIVKAVTDAGYGARKKGAAAASSSSVSSAADADAFDASPADAEAALLKKRLIASLVFLAALMYVSMGHGMLGWPLPPLLAGPAGGGVMQMLLAGIIMAVNRKFFVSGFRGLMHRAPNMDTLVAMGATAAFLWSVYVLLVLVNGGAGELYFESAGMILTLITVGKLLEARAKGKTTDALKSLMRLAPRTATVLRDGAETVVPVADVRVGDVFIVRPGDSIPVDGVVVSGDAAVDEAALTGESVPVDKAAGDAVSAATVNRSGCLTCEAVRVGEDTTLSQIIRMVSDASATKAPIARIADKVSGVFVPAVMAIAVVTAAVWLLLGRPAGFALARGISVLVISCPCALGLATPVAIMVGSGVGAKNGILFKTAVSLEQAGRAKIVVLDKTGTLTTGDMRVTDVLPADGVTEEELLRLACAAEQPSEHPLARAVVRFAGERGIQPEPVTRFRALPGSGVEAALAGARLEAGSGTYIAARTALPPALLTAGERLSAEGKTPLYFLRDGSPLGLLAVADGLKPDAADAVRELKGMGLRVVMLTGDNERTARAVGAQAGVDDVVAGVLPDGKEAVVRRLMERGTVIMVGDGVNDAPALTAADVGVAIGAGTDVAVDAADIVLTRSRAADIPAAVRLSRATLRNIHENLFWAFFYNCLGIPLAAGAFIGAFGWELNPMFGAAAMSLSSFCVVTNALRLNLVDIRSPRRDRKITHPVTDIGPVTPAGDIPADHTKEEISMEKTLKIEGMMCAHCEARVKKALESVEGVESAAVSHETGAAVVTLTAPVPDEALKSAVEAQDYKVIGVE